MHLYDKVFGKNTHRAFENFIGYTRENYMKVGTDGKLQSVTSYYDPIEKFHSGGSAAGGLMTAHLMQPQNPELGRLLYDGAANALGWRNATGDIRANTTGLVMAREMGDDVAYERLRAAAEREYEPRFFGEHQETVRLVLQQQGRVPARAGERDADGRRDRRARRLDARLRGAASGQIHRADRRRHRVPVPRRLAGVERSGHRHIARRDVCGGSRQARGCDAVARHEPAERLEPHRSVERSALHPLCGGGAANDRDDDDDRRAPVRDRDRIPGRRHARGVETAREAARGSAAASLLATTDGDRRASRTRCGGPRVSVLSVGLIY